VLCYANRVRADLFVQPGLQESVHLRDVLSKGSVRVSHKLS